MSHFYSLIISCHPSSIHYSLFTILVLWEWLVTIVRSWCLLLRMGGWIATHPCFFCSHLPPHHSLHKSIYHSVSLSYSFYPEFLLGQSMCPLSWELLDCVLCYDLCVCVVVVAEVIDLGAHVTQTMPPYTMLFFLFSLRFFWRWYYQSVSNYFVCVRVGVCT